MQGTMSDARKLGEVSTQATHGLGGQHQDMDRTVSGKAIRMTEDRDKWCGQPSDRGRLKNRTENIVPVLHLVNSALSIYTNFGLCKPCNL